MNRTPQTLLKGNWQSCQEQDGTYAEAIVDYPKDDLEVHLGPKWEFAIFRGIQDDHRPHEGAALRLNSEPNNGQLRYKATSKDLGVRFEAILAGGSKLFCESFVVSLERVKGGLHG